MGDTSTRNSLYLPLAADGGNTFYSSIHTNFETVDSAISKCRWDASAAPTADDDDGDGYMVGSIWVDTTNHIIYFCEDATTTAAVWRQLYPLDIIGIGANVDFGAYEVRAQTFQSDQATGTAPFTVASTTKVNNLNADQLDGLDDTAFLKAAGTVGLSANWDAGSYKITAETLASDVATGTAPFTVASTTKVNNLNADQLDGLDDTAFLKHSLATAANDFLIATGSGAYVKKTLAESQVILKVDKYCLEFQFDGNGAAITTGVKPGLEIPIAGTITAARMISNDATSGSIVVDLWKDTYANAPPTDADSITASAPPTISTSTKSEDTTLTNWTKTVAAGEWIVPNVDSCTSIKSCTLSLTVAV